jgi:hypothetical protein
LCLHHHSPCLICRHQHINSVDFWPKSTTATRPRPISFRQIHLKLPQTTINITHLWTMLKGTTRVHRVCSNLFVQPSTKQTWWLLFFCAFVFTTTLWKLALSQQFCTWGITGTVLCIFNLHHIAYEFISNKFILFASSCLHEGVINA